MWWKSAGMISMPTLYTIYAAVLVERIGTKIDEKGLLLSNQAEFKKAKETLDNIFVLNHPMNKQLGKN